MANMEYISSAGLRILLAAKKKMIEIDGTMVISRVKKEVLETFMVTGFDEILDVK